MTAEPPDIKRLRGIVMQRQAEFEIAEAELREAIKDKWMPVSFADLYRVAGEHRPPKCEILTPHDWESGSFEYVATFQWDRDQVAATVGGYRDNDRFLGLVIVYIRPGDWNALHHEH